MKRLVFIFPHLTSYVLPLLQGMAESGRVMIDMVHGPLPSDMGFDDQLPPEHPNIRWIQVQRFPPLGDSAIMYQKGVLSHIFKTRPDVIFIWANPRYISFWGVLILGRLLHIPVFPRGHGLFKKDQVGISQKIMYKVMLALSHRYICYTPAVKKSLQSLVKREVKLVVDYNTLYNLYPVTPNEKTGREKGVFYIGRVRPGCGVEVLIQTLELLNQQDDLNIDLHVIGDGPLGEFLQEKASRFPWLKYYGKVFDQKRISDISRECRLGCVPGFMGLNVVHMMSLSLPVVTHSRLEQHMGPEPEYILHKVNGWFVEKPNDVSSLTEVLRQLWLMPNAEFKSLQENAHKTYEELSTPPFHERVLQILGLNDAIIT